MGQSVKLGTLEALLVKIEKNLIFGCRLGNGKRTNRDHCGQAGIQFATKSLWPAALHFMTAFPGHHFSYEPMTCKRYLGSDIWCQEEFTSAYELKNHRKTCFWACRESGCQKKGETRKQQIDKHERKHEADNQKLFRLSQFMLEP